MMGDVLLRIWWVGALLACEGRSSAVDAAVDSFADAAVDSFEDAAVDSVADAAVDSDADPLAGCRGAVVPIALHHELPYVEVAIGDARGWFLVDWGTTASAIDPSAFVPRAPSPLAGTSNRWDDFAFFGSWGTVTLWPQDFSAFVDPPQAGILGTDFLSLNVFVVDWRGKTLARAEPGAACSATTLRAAGFRALSSAGFFARDLDRLADGVPNVPTIPVRIGGVVAPAQIDTGYDDALAGPAVNVNAAFFAAIPDGVLERAAGLDLVLTTCVPGVVEPVDAWRLARGGPVELVELVGADGDVVRREADAIVFVKRTPDAARGCGGIGTWHTPAAQLGVSFMARAGVVVFDPERSEVWLGP